MTKHIVTGAIMIGLLMGGYIWGHYDQAPTTPAQAVVESTVDPHASFTYDNILVRLNETRLSNNLPQLATDNYLSTYAQKDLIGNCPVTGHGTFRSEQASFTEYKQLGEVLQSGSGTPNQAIATLMASPTHRDILLTKAYTSVGIGVTGNCISLILGFK